VELDIAGGVVGDGDRVPVVGDAALAEVAGAEHPGPELDGDFFEDLVGGLGGGDVEVSPAGIA
jgi:hypothetical protein